MFDCIIFVNDAGGSGYVSDFVTSREISFKPVISCIVDEVLKLSNQVSIFGDNCDSLSGLADAYIKCFGREAVDLFEIKNDTILLINCNVPLITSKTISKAFDFHKNSKNLITILGCDDFVEADFDVAFVDSAYLKSVLCNLNDIYSLIDVARRECKSIGKYIVDDKNELYRVTDCLELSYAESVMQKRLLKKHMQNGVSFLSADSVFLGSDVEIESKTLIMPNTIIKGKSKIGSGCVIGPNSQICDSEISDNVEINSSVVLESFVDQNTKVGPFAYIRPHCKIGKNIKIGDFVEIKNSTIDDNTKVSHLTYVGDADVGKNVNFGCGTVLVNYDGARKHRSTIENNAFIGCNTNLVSPVTVKENAFIAAGSTITDDVPENSLAIARARQVVKKDWERKSK